MSYPPKGRADFYQPGGWNAVCSMCGHKRKASSLVLNWQGQWRCPEHNEPRQPQDFVRAVPDIETPPWTQPGSDSFVNPSGPPQRSALSGYGIAGASIAGTSCPSTYLHWN